MKAVGHIFSLCERTVGPLTASSRFTAVQQDRPTKSEVREDMFKRGKCKESFRIQTLTALACVEVISGNDFNSSRGFFRGGGAEQEN